MEDKPVRGQRPSMISRRSQSQRIPRSMKSRGSASRGNSPSPFSASRLNIPADRAPTLLNGPFTLMPLHELLPLLSSTEKLFFAGLDHELEKIEAFYEKQENSLQEHTQMLKEQLNELAEHRKQFYVSLRVWEAFPEHKQTLASALKQYQSGLRWRLRLGKAKENELEQTFELSSAQPPSMKRPTTTGTAFSNDESDNAGTSEGNALDASSRLLAPDEYHHAKKKLRKAVVEHYRKALKKFEKFTKVETSAFYSDKAVNAMLEEMEGVYTLRLDHCMASCLVGLCGSCVLPTVPLPLQTLKVLASTENRKATDVGDKTRGETSSVACSSHCQTCTCSHVFMPEVLTISGGDVELPLPIGPLPSRLEYCPS
ncbi:EXS family-domain-containing protein [Salix suchowensis]|nr:EXS family-domain-containing protein [Salix suchowensis]